MSLPVSNEYLVAALTDDVKFGNTVLKHRTVGDLLLPTGKLVACDPVVFPEAEHFDLLLPKGSFPVVLSAEMDKTYVHTWSWLNFKIGDGLQNIVAFSSGFGDGMYASYAGSDTESEVAVIVTDFGVVELK